MSDKKEWRELFVLKASLKLGDDVNATTINAFRKKKDLPSPALHFIEKAAYEAEKQRADRLEKARDLALSESKKDADLVETLEKKNQKLKEALEEIAKPPYSDSDLRSFCEWISARTREALK